MSNETRDRGVTDTSRSSGVEGEEVVSGREARQGYRDGIILLVLGLSIAGVIVAFAAAFLFSEVTENPTGVGIEGEQVAEEEPAEEIAAPDEVLAE